MKKLLTIKQQDKRVRILEQARSPYASRINCQVFHKTLRNRIGENIASELENGVEITENTLNIGMIIGNIPRRLITILDIGMII